MITINPHINFNGNAEEAFTFYQSVLGGEFIQVIRFKDIQNRSFKINSSEENKIMYIVMQIGPTTLIGNDIPSAVGKTNELENRSKIAIRSLSKEEADRIFKELSIGGVVEFDMGDSPGVAYYGGFRDKYGVEWTVSYEQ